MTDEVPEFLKEDLLGLDSPVRTEEDSKDSSTRPTSNGALFNFQSDNLSHLFSGGNSSFYTPSSDTSSISPTNDLAQNREFNSFSNPNFSHSFGGYEQRSPKDLSSNLWNGITSGFSQLDLGTNPTSPSQESQTDFMFSRQNQQPHPTRMNEIPSYNQMMWNGGLGPPLYSGSPASPLFSESLSGHSFSSNLGTSEQHSGGMESPFRGMIPRDDYRSPGAQMNSIRNPMSNGTIFPPMYQPNMMVQPPHQPNAPRNISHEYGPPTNTQNIPVSPTMSHHQRSVSVDSYIPESDPFTPHISDLQPVQRHKRNPSSNAVDSYENGTKQISGCRYYASGYCSRGDRCNYDHIPHEDKRVINSQMRGRRPRVPVASIPVDIDKTVESRYQTLDQVVGQVYSMCKDQHGCRFLQKKLEEKDNNYEAVNIIFDEVYDHMVELMTDPFGNYLCQKLIEHCDEQQQLVIVQKVASQLVEISKNMHGTRAVQKMIECLCTSSQVQLVVNALKSSVVELIQDLNGNHVIQRCLNRLSTRDKQFIYDAVAEHAVEVSTHRHGCCVMQRCIDSASDAQKLQLVRQISKNALALVKDQFGNYVVQYVLELDFAIVHNELIREFCGHIASLSTQKFSSNVIEKCLHVASPEVQRELIEEIMLPNTLSLLLQDPFGNYVIQTALSIAPPAQYRRLVEEIKPRLPALRNTPYGKRIQNKIARD